MGCLGIIAYVLLQMILVPAFASIIVYLASKKIAEKVGWITFIVLCYTLLLCSLTYGQISTSGAFVEDYQWAPNVGLNLLLQADGLNIPFVFTIILNLMYERKRPLPSL